MVSFDFKKIKREYRLISLSPSKKLALISIINKRNNLAIYDLDSGLLKTIDLSRNFTLKNHLIDWSFDSSYFLLLKRGENFVTIVDSKFCSLSKIEYESPVVFAQNGHKNDHFVVILEFCLRMYISIRSKKIKFYVFEPKLEDSNGFCYSQDGKYIAVLERRNHCDFICVFNCRDLFVLANRFKLSTKDAISINFMKTNDFIIVIDSLLNSQILVYSIDGFLLFKKSQKMLKLPLKNSNCSPLKNIVQVNNGKNKIILFNPFLPEFVFVFNVVEQIDYFLSIENSNTFFEVPWDFMKGIENENNKNSKTKYVNYKIKMKKEKIKKDEKSIEKIKNLIWSQKSDFFAFIFKKTKIIIFDIKLMAIKSIICQNEEIAAMKWNGEKLYFCSGDKSFYCWSEKNCFVVDFPFDEKIKPFSMKIIENDKILFKSKTKSCFCQIND